MTMARGRCPETRSRRDHEAGVDIVTTGYISGDTLDVTFTLSNGGGLPWQRHLRGTIASGASIEQLSRDDGRPRVASCFEERRLHASRSDGLQGERDERQRCEASADMEGRAGAKPVPQHARDATGDQHRGATHEVEDPEGGPA